MTQGGDVASYDSVLAQNVQLKIDLQSSLSELSRKEEFHIPWMALTVATLAVAGRTLAVASRPRGYSRLWRCRIFGSVLDFRTLRSGEVLLFRVEERIC
eukprot:symbB.v1.2.008778.t1/scaffold514.1/size193457/4